MPYTEHPSIHTPEDRSLKIWRYMDFTKFVAMLEDQALFFSNLARLRDPLEGFLTFPTAERFRFVPDDVEPKEANRRREVGEYNLSFMRWGRNLVYVSSWHINNHESAAMWRLYIKAGEGVAIESTVGSMIDSFSGTTEHIHIGDIEYVDYERTDIPWDNVFSPAMYKRKSFEHEKELRAVVMDGDNAPGKLLAVDLKTLIYKIHLAPDSEGWIHGLLKKVLARYGLEKDVLNSALDQTPLY
jgi:hypothetical protein